jgi:D-3-phosphoglycerate dehydrogenase / 2-oxoglutarate reductase
VNTNQISVLISDPIEEACSDILIEEGFPVDRKTGLTEDELCEVIKDYSVLIVRSSTQVTKKVIEHGTRS